MTAHDLAFAKIIRWLQAHGREMHTPRKGETYVCARRRRRRDSMGLSLPSPLWEPRQ